MSKIFLIAAVVAGVIVYMKLKKGSSSDTVLEKNKKEEPAAIDMKRDVICGSFVEDTTKYKVRLYDKVYYFCSEECKEKFIKENTK